MKKSSLILPQRPQRTCIYCGKIGFKVKKGEHIFPDALGGVRTIKEVCPECNNGKLSEIDDHLISSSPIAFAAGEILGRGVGRTWDVDERANRMLMEARPDWKSQSMTLWPQLILTEAGVALRADFNEIQSFGVESFPRFLLGKIRTAFGKWNRGQRNKLIFERLDFAREIEKGYSYPPRVFAKKTLAELVDGEQAFFIGYAGERDKRRMVNTIANLEQHQPFHFNRALGTSEPLVTRGWSHLKVLRALTKIGINLLYDSCKSTTVDSQHFPGAIGFVLGTKVPSADLLKSSGFVGPKELADLHRDDSGHSARLSYQSGIWTVEISFFGGRVCAVVQIPGPCNEPWTNCKIGTPLASQDCDISNDWQVTTSKLYVPRNYRFSWNDPSVIIPSVDLANVHKQPL